MRALQRILGNQQADRSDRRSETPEANDLGKGGLTQVVQVSGVRKEYSGSVAIESVSFSVTDGEILALLGPSGCGKTTLLRCIAGLETVQAGEIRIGNELVSSPRDSIPPERRDVGFIFQSYALWPHLTVWQHVEYGLRVAKVAKAERDVRCEDMLSLVDLLAYARRTPGQLSGGQQQRVALARSLVVRPRVLLLDEPLSNLDAALRDRMRQEIRTVLKRVGTTAIFVTHDQREAFAISDRVVLMNNGIAVQVDVPELLYASPRNVFAATFLGAANLLPVTVIMGSPPNVSAESTDMGRLRGSSITGEKTEAMFAMFRPEDVTCRPMDGAESMGANVWEGEVVQRTFEGAAVELVVQVKATQLRLTGAHNGVQAGDKVVVHVPPSKLQFLSA